MIELRQLRYALMAAEQRSFSRAAISLNMKQSTLSRKVLRLEDQLGFKLFERSTRGAHPTKMAAPFLEAARQVMADMEGLQRQAIALRNGRHGRLALGYSGSLFSGPLIRALSTYFELYPEVQFDGYEHSPQRLFEALRAGTVDAVVAPCGLRLGDTEQVSLWSEPLRVCFANTHRLAACHPIAWSDLNHEQFLISAHGLGSVVRDILASALGREPDGPQIFLQDTGIDSILNLVARTKKVTLLVQQVPSMLPMVQSRTIYDARGQVWIDFALHWSNTNSNPTLTKFRKVVKDLADDQ